MIFRELEWRWGLGFLGRIGVFFLVLAFRVDGWGTGYFVRLFRGSRGFWYIVMVFFYV